MRPIDADALYKNLGFAEECKDCDHQYNSVFCESSTWQVVCDAIYEAPTVYAVPRWIPCEERLPDNESVVLVTDNNGHIRHAFYDEECDWFGTYEESMTIRAIAWMPLPEPYDVERKDDEVHKNG